MPATMRTVARPLVRSRWHDVDGLRVHSRTTGAGPPVVLVHGYAVSGAYLLPLAEALAERCTAYVPDLPGHGGSDPPNAATDIPRLAESLAAWVELLGLERPGFVANSMGCQIVTELAARWPERAGPLVLIGPTVDPRRRRMRNQLFSLLRDAAREPTCLVALSAVDTVRAKPWQLLAAARSALSDRIEERLPLIEQQTVVVHAGNDGFVSREWAEQVTALLPRARLQVFPGEPHAIHYTQPDLVAGIVWDLLAEEGWLPIERPANTSAGRSSKARPMSQARGHNLAAIVE